jgi:S1-C subfamily serine protease
VAVQVRKSGAQQSQRRNSRERGALFLSESCGNRGKPLSISTWSRVARAARLPAPVNLAEFKNGYAPVIDPALPAVLSISSTKMVKQQNNFPGLFNDPFFRQFFGDQFNRQLNRPETEREYSLGSGVVVNPDGYILTNNHVVSGASDIQVFTEDKKKFKAKVIGIDSKIDIAVLKIDASGIPAVTLGDSSKLKVGDVVFAIGDPFGVGETATKLSRQD